MTMTATQSDGDQSDSLGFASLKKARNLSPITQKMLWGMAGGRCEFNGCNKSVWKSSVTQEIVNLAENAHIYSFSDGGPRGNAGIKKSEINNIENLLLVCGSCHKTIDDKKDGGRYTVAQLQEWKSDHERRVDIVTGIAPDKKSHVILYEATIGQQMPLPQFDKAAAAMFPESYPYERSAVRLGIANGTLGERDASFWKYESDQLQRSFKERVKPLIRVDGVDHFSVFALAPQPLLMLLGTLFGDIATVDVYQPHREPPGWRWPSSALPIPFIVEEPQSRNGTPALVFSLSATVVPQRIQSVLGNTVSIWNVTIPTPHNDFVKCRQQLSMFRKEMRLLLDRIKAEHGQTTTLHIFPAMPASLALEFGRIIMPKADMPWQVYDQVNALGGFIPTLSISSGES